MDESGNIKVLFNGAPITDHFSGAIRYEIEILSELDKIAAGKGYSIILREEYVDKLDLKNIRKFTFKTGSRMGRFLEVYAFCRKHKCLYIHFCNPFGMSRNYSISVWHDIYSFYDVTGEDKIKLFLKRMKAKEAAIFSKTIVTVSEYSKKTMLDMLPINDKRIKIIPNGWQHIKSIIPDETVIRRMHLDNDDFFFFIGRLVRNKNMEWIFEIADNNAGAFFVIAGAIQASEKFVPYYGKNKNIVYTGFVTDEEMAALYMHCKAFLFPSLMEGFGIPPMEALYYGKPVIISNTSSLPEIYEDAAHYIDPYKYDYDLNEILKEPVGDPQKILDKYSWEKSAQMWHELIMSVAEE